MQTFKVEPTKLAIGYDTFEEAIAAAQRGPRVRDAELTTARLKGATLARITTTLSTTTLEFSNNLELRVSLGAHGEPDWQLTHASGNGLNSPFTPIPLSYLKPDGTVREWVWDPDSRANEIIERKFVQLFPSSPWLFLDVQRAELTFLGYRLVESGEAILYWDWAKEDW